MFDFGPNAGQVVSIIKRRTYERHSTSTSGYTTKAEHNIQYYPGRWLGYRRHCCGVFRSSHECVAEQSCGTAIAGESNAVRLKAGTSTIRASQGRGCQGSDKRTNNSRSTLEVAVAVSANAVTVRPGQERDCNCTTEHAEIVCGNCEFAGTTGTGQKGECSAAITAKRDAVAVGSGKKDGMKLKLPPAPQAPRSDE